MNAQASPRTGRWITAATATWRPVTLLVALLLALPLPATAVIVTVNSTGDADDADLFDGVCDTGGSVGTDPECTLRAALRHSLEFPSGPNSIVFDPALGSAPLLITPASPLTLPGFWTTLDGYSIPGASENTLPSGWDGVIGVVIDGGGIPGTDPQVLLVVGSSRSTVQGVALTNSTARPGLVGVELGSGESKLRGSLIGTDLSGPTTEGFDVGARISGSTSTQSIEIGGALPGDRNLISGNGIGLLVKPTFGNLGGQHVIAGNYIGTAGPNGTGIRFESVKFGGQLIGGSVPDPAAPGPRNVISGNIGNGVELHDSNNLSLRGNRIGVGPTGLPFPNGGNGVSLTGGSSSIFFGEFTGFPDSASANEIAHNALAGVSLVSDPPGADDAGSFVSIPGNSIHGNGGLGIALSDPFVPLANDLGDGDFGPNELQNHPTILDVVRPDTGASDTVTVRMDGPPNGFFEIDVYANAACDPSGHGEGKTWLARGNLSTDATGSGELTLDVTIEDAEAIITAIANPNGSTSEFSPCFDARDVMPGTIGFRDTKLTVREGDVASCGGAPVTGACIVVDRVGGTDGTVSVLLDDIEGTARVGLDYRGVTLPPIVEFPDGSAAIVFPLEIFDDLVAEGDEHLRLLLSGPTGGAALDPSRDMLNITIADDEAPVQITDSVVPIDDEIVDFGLLEPGATKFESVQLINWMGEDYEIVSIESASPPFSNGAGDCTWLGPTESCSFGIAFEPTEEGAWQQSVTLQYRPLAGGSLVESTVLFRGEASTDADLSVEKRAEKGLYYDLGEQVIYEILVTNHGPSDATGVVMTDTLDPGLAANAPLILDGGPVGTTQWLAGSRQLVWQVGDLAADQQVRLAYRVDAPVPNDPVILSNSAVVFSTAPDHTEPDTTDNNVVHEIFVGGSDLQVSASWIVDRTEAPTVTTAYFKVKNLGPHPLDRLDFRIEAERFLKPDGEYHSVLGVLRVPFNSPFRWCTPVSADDDPVQVFTCEVDEFKLETMSHLDPDRSETAIFELDFTWFTGPGTSSTVPRGTPFNVTASVEVPSGVDLNPANDSATIVIKVPYPEPYSPGLPCPVEITAAEAQLESHLPALRRFRDDTLLASAPGRAFVDWYYLHSPAMTAQLRAHPALRWPAAVAIVTVGTAVDAPRTSAAGLALPLGALVLARRRRR